MNQFYRREVLGDIGEDAQQMSLEKLFSKVKVIVEGEETKRFLKTITGKLGDDDEASDESDNEFSFEEDDEDIFEDLPLLKYESSFVKRLLLP